jgi:Fic family protein
MLKFIKDRVNDYNANAFVNELAEASKKLGILEAKINAYQFDAILVPILHKKEAISSMYIEGTQTTISSAFEGDLTPNIADDKTQLEVSNHTRALAYGSEYLIRNNFTHSFIKDIHKIMLIGLEPIRADKPLGNYKVANNKIVNSAGTEIFTPPPYTETQKYMDELITFMNDSVDGINSLIKAAIIHSQFESIHPFADGNGRVGRLLVSLYLYKAKVINFPFFFISEAISADKLVYYNMLTSSRNSSYDDWIKYFLQKIIIQSEKHIGYIDSLNVLYTQVKEVVKKVINSPKYDAIINCLFTQPVLNADYLVDKLQISRGQAVRYLNILESEHILAGDDRKRGRRYRFLRLFELANK